MRREIYTRSPTWQQPKQASRQAEGACLLGHSADLYCTAEADAHPIRLRSSGCVSWQGSRDTIPLTLLVILFRCRCVSAAASVYVPYTYLRCRESLVHRRCLYLLAGWLIRLALAVAAAFTTTTIATTSSTAPCLPGVFAAAGIGAVGTFW